MAYAYLSNIDETFEEEIMPQTGRSMTEARFLNNDTVFTEKAPWTQWIVFNMSRIGTNRKGQPIYNIVIRDARDPMHPMVYGEQKQQHISEERAEEILTRQEHKGLNVIKSPDPKVIMERFMNLQKEYWKIHGRNRRAAVR